MRNRTNQKPVDRNDSFRRPVRSPGRKRIAQGKNRALPRTRSRCGTCHRLAPQHRRTTTHSDGETNLDSLFRTLCRRLDHPFFVTFLLAYRSARLAALAEFPRRCRHEFHLRLLPLPTIPQFLLRPRTGCLHQTIGCTDSRLSASRRCPHQTSGLRMARTTGPVGKRVASHARSRRTMGSASVTHLSDRIRDLSISSMAVARDTWQREERLQLRLIELKRI